MPVGWDEGNAIEPFSSDFQACEDFIFEKINAKVTMGSFLFLKFEVATCIGGQ